jgi:hypothetical protein
MPIQQGQAQQAQAHVESLPPPVGGWNARDALANMAPTDAVKLTNMFPGVASCDLRGGVQQWATGLSGDVQTLMVYSPGAIGKLFAADSVGLKVYDVTNQGPVGAAVVSGLSNAKLEYANITTPGGSFLYFVNGQDKPRLYDGTTWTAIDGASTPAITGVNTQNLVNVFLFKHRLWFIEKNTLRAWYLPTDSIGGAAQVFDLGAVAMAGGFLVDICAWTLDAGYGSDDNLVFTTSKGEIIVYRGTDPASASTWAQMGVWQLGAPVGGARCTKKFGGDTLILTLDGLIPLAQGLQSSRLDPRIALSDKIQGAIADATTAFQLNFGWQIFYYAKQNAVWVNVPKGAGLQEQYVMNTITGAWCNFTQWAANCWALFTDEPFYGGAGAVYRAWALNFTDNNNANIDAYAMQAYNYFEMRGVEKYFTRARPNILTTGVPSIKVGISVDFNINQQPLPISFAPVAYAVWDQALWDVDVWGQTPSLQSNWQGVAGIGYCGAVEFQTSSQGIQVSWASTDVVFQAGWAGI